jgi:galactokinase
MIVSAENKMAVKLQERFSSVFNKSAELVVRSPGRVNIIGEHTDYNDGFVLPAAVDKAIYVAVAKRTDDILSFFSVDFNESFQVSIQDRRPTPAWHTYILGVVNELITRGYSVSGFNLAIDGDIPIGAGLSSSAAVECAVVFALNNLFELHIEPIEMIRIAQKAEHVYAGVLCGIMDQFASLMGKKDHVIKLDCRTLQFEYKPFRLDGYKIVLLNTNVKHSLASSAYNQRRQECEQGVAWVKTAYPEVRSLRDVTIAMLDACVLQKHKIVYNRCRYVVEEIKRLLDGCDDLEHDNIPALGQKMFATHEGLSKQYEVSCPEADFLVEAVKNNPNVQGARMMGGGFGGCTINIIKEEAIDELVTKLSAQYKKAMGLELSFYISKIENGTEMIARF